MKVGYFGDGPWAHRALEALQGLQGVEIVFITPRFDTQDPVLAAWAEKLNVPYLPHPDVNRSDFIERVGATGAELLISMSFNQILRREIIERPALGFINCHAGALPFYRGRNPINWALINGESRIGVTAHYIDEGIDTGDIIRQRFIEIDAQDDYGTLLQKAFEVCSDVLVDAVQDIRDGTVTATPQKEIHPVGFYCGRRRPGDEQLCWEWPSLRIHNFVRAITHPGPGARCLGPTGQALAIGKTELVDQAPAYLGTCGEVVGRDEGGVYVKSGDSIVKIVGVADVDAQGNALQTYIPRYPIGSRLK